MLKADKRVSRVIKTTVIAGVVALALSACGLALPGTYDPVDKAADELSLESAGEITAEGHFGGTVGFSPAPQYWAFVEGEGAPDAVAELAIKSNYENSLSEGGTSFWNRGQGDRHFDLSITEVKAGEEVVTDNGDKWEAETDGAFVKVVGGRYPPTQGARRSAPSPE